MGGPIIRGGGGSVGMDLVAGQFVGAGGELSREDDVVDVLVTSMFNDADAPFARKPLTDVPKGGLKRRP